MRKLRAGRLTINYDFVRISLPRFRYIDFVGKINYTNYFLLFKNQYNNIKEKELECILSNCLVTKIIQLQTMMCSVTTFI